MCNCLQYVLIPDAQLVKPVSVDSPLQSSTSNTLQSKKQSRKTAGIVAATVADDEAQTSVVQSSKVCWGAQAMRTGHVQQQCTDYTGIESSKA